MLFNCDCTVFNRLPPSLDGSECWQPARLCGVNWQESRGRRVGSAGAFGDDSIKVYIPFSVACARPYAAPRLFELSPESFFTLREGDVLVRGAFFPEDMLFSSTAEIAAYFEKTMIIASVASNDFGSAALAHWEVGENEYNQRY